MCFLRRRSRKRYAVGELGGRERRTSCRYPAVLHAGLLIWESQDMRFEEPVVLENVSLEGCMLKARAGPGDQPGLRVRLRSPAIDNLDGIEGELIGSQRSALGAESIRIRFLEPLSFTSFKNLVYGPDLRSPQNTIVREHERDCYWR